MLKNKQIGFCIFPILEVLLLSLIALLVVVFTFKTTTINTNDKANKNHYKEDINIVKETLND